jgi:CRISPR-associated protein Cas1
MIKRVVDISEPAYLHVKNRQLLIDKEGKTVAQLPIEDLGVLILQNPAIVLTQALIVACQQNNVVLVFCDDKHLPYSVILPLTEANSLHSKIIKEQIAVSVPTKKRLWQQVVKHKINGQAQVLKALNKEFKHLQALAESVKAGDCDNLEAQAAQLYWRLLFGEDFTRDRELEGINSLLNYGYAIMRAMVARAIVGSGLHPALGLQHHNQYDGLCLADDLMEPFRPWVDLIVHRLSEMQGDLTVTRETKVPLLSLLSESVIWQGENMPLMVACHYLLADFKRCLSDSGMKLCYPQQSIHLGVKQL